MPLMLYHRSRSVTPYPPPFFTPNFANSIANSKLQSLLFCHMM
jgi:hypothetical protein